MHRLLRRVATAVALGTLGAGIASASPIGVMFESDADRPGGFELAFSTYPTMADLLAGTNGMSQFSAIDVNAAFNN
jgi:hypothetical protein